MSLASRLNPQRSGVKSVLFWASSLVESQRPRAKIVDIDEEQQRADDNNNNNNNNNNGDGDGDGDGEKPQCTTEEGAGVEEKEREEEIDTCVEEVPHTTTVEAAEAQTDACTQDEEFSRFKDVLTVGESLLQGQLGPVAIDVELNGATALLRDPKGFAAILDSLERASCDNLRSFHASIQLFFIVRGVSYYTLSSSVSSPLVFLAKLLSSPTARKIVLNAQLMYRLLFLFLGTDRVEVSNLVDIAVWSTIVERVSGAGPHLNSCYNSDSLWEVLPDTAKESIGVQIEKAKQARWYEETLCPERSEEGITQDEEEEEEGDCSGGGVATRRKRRRVAVASATSTMPSLFFSTEIPIGQLLERLKSLSVLYTYYETHLRFVDSSGATGVVSMPLLSVCEMETHASFLCEVMSYHGMFIDKNLFDSMVGDLVHQLKSLAAKGNAALEAITKNKEIDEEITIETMTAWDLLDFLKKQCSDLPVVVGNWEQQIQQLAAHFDDAQMSGDANIPRIWLALHERIEFKNSLMGTFSSGTSIHARLIALPEEMTAAEGGGGVATANISGSDPRSVITSQHHHHQLFYSVHPKWSVHHSSTSRLYCSGPCLQTVAKNPPLSHATLSSSTSETVTMFSNPAWTLRHLYGPPPGCTLLSFDFNQIELRVLAHLSGDELLLQQLRGGSDVLAEMALRVMQLPRLEDVTPYLRECTKVVVYGLLYGMGPELMDLRLQHMRKETVGFSEQPALSARQFLYSFNRCYPAVKAFLKRTRQSALHEKRCLTLNGLRDLSSEVDANRRKQKAVALAIQGGAAVILHHAMVEVHKRRHEFVPYFPAAAFALVLSVHDELVYAVPDSAVHIVAPRIKRVLEQQAVALSLGVPLPVSTKFGKSFGSLEPMPL